MAGSHRNPANRGAIAERGRGSGRILGEHLDEIREHDDDGRLAQRREPGAFEVPLHDLRRDDRRAEARLRAWRRTQLAALAERQAGAEPVTVEEAQRYYTANEARVRGEVMVAQMLIRDEAAAESALRELRGGVSFDDVARRLHPNLADPAARPWEMGFLRWQQIPDAWRGPLDGLQPGQVSAVIRGPNRRFWILKLLARRQAEGVTFESVRPVIVQRLTEERRAGARDRLRAELLRGARVEYPRGAP